MPATHLARTCGTRRCCCSTRRAGAAAGPLRTSTPAQCADRPATPPARARSQLARPPHLPALPQGVRRARAEPSAHAGHDSGAGVSRVVRVLRARAQHAAPLGLPVPELLAAAGVVGGGGVRAQNRHGGGGRGRRERVVRRPHGLRLHRLPDLGAADGTHAEPGHGAAQVRGGRHERASPRAPRIVRRLRLDRLDHAAAAPRVRPATAAPRRSPPGSRTAGWSPVRACFAGSTMRHGGASRCSAGQRAPKQRPCRSGSR